MDRFGPGKSRLGGLTLVLTGLGAFTYGVATQVDYSPTLLGDGDHRHGSGCALLPISGSAVRTLAKRQLARGATLIMVTQMVAGPVGGALLSVLLTNQLDHSENVATANKITILQQKATESGMPVDPSAIPRAALAPDFIRNVEKDLSHAYTTVFMVAIVLVALTFIPAAFLPRKRATLPPRRDVSALRWY